MSRAETDGLVQKLVLIGQVLPDREQLEAFVRAADHEEATAPIFHPSAYMRAQKRLPALRDLARAALKYHAAFARLQEAAAAESDPEIDGPMQQALAAEQRRLGRWPPEPAGGG